MEFAFFSSWFHAKHYLYIIRTRKQLKKYKYYFGHTTNFSTNIERANLLFMTIVTSWSHDQVRWPILSGLGYLQLTSAVSFRTNYIQHTFPWWWWWRWGDSLWWLVLNIPAATSRIGLLSQRLLLNTDDVQTNNYLAASPPTPLSP